MQIEPGIDFLAAAGQLRTLATPERCQRRRGRRFWLWQVGCFRNRKQRGRWLCDGRPLDLRGGSDRRLCGMRLLPQRLGLLRDAFPQRALLFTQRALAPWQKQRLRKRLRTFHR
jgi:hypothetical protein